MFSCSAAAPTTEAVPPQPPQQRGPRNPRDDRSRGGRGGMSFGQGGPPNRDRMARGGSKGPDGGPDSGQGLLYLNIFVSDGMSIIVERISPTKSNSDR